MAVQSGAIRGSSRKRNQIAELNARQGLLPAMLQNKEKRIAMDRQKELDALQVSQFDRGHNLEQQQFAYNKQSSEQNRQMANRASQVGMGLAAGKMGMNIGMTSGGKTLGDLGRAVSTSGIPGTSGFGPKSGGWSDKVDLGSMVGGGLMGYGAGQLIGGKSKIKKAGVGMLAGGLMGMLGGPKGGGMNWGSIFSGGIGGAFGGLF